MKRLSLSLWIGLFGIGSSQAAFRFGLANSAAKRGANVVDQVLPLSIVLILPVLPSQVATQGQVIWPFGVQAGGHPNGHPGIDFQTVIGAAVLASANGKVREVSDRSVDSPEKEKVIIIDHARNQGAYVGSLINITVSVGDFVVQGQKLADLGAFQGGLPYGFLHWGLSTFMTDQPAAICPYNFLTAEGKADLDQMFARSTYVERSQFPLICNPCPAGGCR